MFHFQPFRTDIWKIVARAHKIDERDLIVVSNLNKNDYEEEEFAKILGHVRQELQKIVNLPWGKEAIKNGIEIYLYTIPIEKV